MQDKGQNKAHNKLQRQGELSANDSFVLEKDIFSNVFERDIRRVYIYKKAERLARALLMISPAFAQSVPMRSRLDVIAMGLVDAAVQSPTIARHALSRELLALSSVLSIARAGGLLSAMNAELISREAQTLLQEIASYEEPRILLEHSMSLSELARAAEREDRTPRTETFVEPKTHAPSPRPQAPKTSAEAKGHIGQVSDNGGGSARRDAILSILGSKGPSYIKDISTLVRDVSEKTIQRELGALVQEGKVTRTGERRWTTYAIAA